MADERQVEAPGRPAWWETLRRWVPTPRHSPFAFGYLAVLLSTSVFQELARPSLVKRLQALSSTDVHNLMHHPVVAMLFSAVWAAGALWSPYLWAVLFTLAPLERRIGGLRAVAVFAAGHIVATLVSQLVVVATVSTGGAGPGLLDELDIGVSYGVLATLGALAGLLRPPGRLIAFAVAALIIAHQFIVDDDLVTGVGHPVALLVGLAFWGRLRPGPDRRVEAEAEAWPIATGRAASYKA